MNETQQRIKAYQEALPGLKERVAAVALLLVMSVAMLTSASFAWLTISYKPAVTGMSTNVATNGNLEIALATGDGETMPGASKVGDSSAAKGQNIAAANITWGNLVNLGDASYGLEGLTLRPAQLNKDALLTSPLYGAVYNDGKENPNSADGRVERLSSDFRYTTWVPASGDLPGYFGIPTEGVGLGVRAISSVQIEAHGFAGQYYLLKSEADASNTAAKNAFIAVTENSTWMASLATMMGTHMTAYLNGEDEYKNAVASQTDLLNLVDMYNALIATYELEADAIADTLNAQLFLAWGGDTTKYTPYTATRVLTELAANTTNAKGQKVDWKKSENGKELYITGIKTLLDDYTKLKTDVVKIEEIANSDNRKWTESGLYTLINRLVNINTCWVENEGKTVSTFLGNMSSNPLSALGYRNSEIQVWITNGVLYNLEMRTGARMKVEPKTGNKTGLPVTAKMYVTTMGLGEQVATIYAKIKTNADSNEFNQDLKYTDTLNTGAGADVGEATAKDTYGMAIDLWVRTNAQDSFLALEGNVLLSDAYTVPVTSLDGQGNTVDLYTYSQMIDSESGKQVVSYDVYKKTADDGTVVWYDAVSHTELAAEDMEGITPVQKVDEKRDVLGYEGADRVWDGNALLAADNINATQGSGSCYVYYADTPEDQANSLKLLEALNVAFYDGVSGDLLAIAGMDTQNYYAGSGRVVVPLVLTDDYENVTTTDGAGGTVEMRAITPLVQNEAMRITALVYLDGTKLGNEDVLAAADIQGQLNIQFGSTVNLAPIANEELENTEYSVSASVSHTSFDYDTATGPMTAEYTVTVNSEGSQPGEVTAYILRQINESQGSREALLRFTYDEASGKWKASHTFTTPGTYILRTVRVDGVDHELYDPENPDANKVPTVVITGFEVKSLSCTQADSATRRIEILSAENSSSVNVSLSFVAESQDKMPKKVSGRFLRADGTAVNIPFTYDPTTRLWSGSGTFLVSGEYTMQYLVLDGEYVELKENLWLTASVTLGMRVEVSTDSPTAFKYLPDEMLEKGTDKLKMKVMIMDNTGNQMPGIQGAKLTYTLRGASYKRMDTDLTWNPSANAYVGELIAYQDGNSSAGGAGVWQFRDVTIGTENTITTATRSPVFTLTPPDPPEFVNADKDDYIFAPSGNANMNYSIRHSSTATVAAIIADASGKEYEVQGVNPTQVGDDTTLTKWYFPIPVVAASQDGTWTMKKITVWNYFDKNGNYISAEVDENGNLVEGGERGEGLSLNVDSYTMKVLQTVKVNFGEVKDEQKTFSGVFMQEYAFPNLSMTITDGSVGGNPIEGISNVTLNVTYKGDSEAKGGYTGVSATDESFTITLTKGADGKTFSWSGDRKLKHAGTYEVDFNFTINDGRPRMMSYSGSTLPAGTPTFSITSTMPSVSITARSNYGSSSNTATSATVYFNKSSGTCNATNYSQSHVTMTLSGYGNAKGATMTFAASNGGTVHLYTSNGGTSAVNNYSWTGNGTCQRWVGYWKSNTGNDNMTAAGTLTSSALTLTGSDGKTYSVAVSKMHSGVNAITISNPGST